MKVSERPSQLISMKTWM